MSTQIVQMFNESNRRMKAITEGVYQPARIAYAQREFEAQIRLINALVSVYAVQSKNKRAMASIQKLKLLDGETSIDINASYETLLVQCPEVDKNITLLECLDFSGDKKNIKKCSECEHFPVARNLIMPKKEE